MAKSTGSVTHWAASTDAGNARMHKAGRTSWSRGDYNKAVETFNRLWPMERELETKEE